MSCALEVALLCTIFRLDTTKCRVAQALRGAAARRPESPHSQGAILMGDVSLEPRQGSGMWTARSRALLSLDFALRDWVELPTGGATHVSSGA